MAAEAIAAMGHPEETDTDTDTDTEVMEEMCYGAIDASPSPSPPPSLSEMCLDVAARSVDVWKRQKRSLECLPSHLSHTLFHLLLTRSSTLFNNPPLLELFQYSLEEVNVSGEASVDAEWTAYFRKFRCLRVLEAAKCKSLSNIAVSFLKEIGTLEELNISSCPKITDQGLSHLLCMVNLKKLGLSETKVTTRGLMGLSSLKGLTSLDLGGLPVTDTVLMSLSDLTELENLDIWGSNVSNQGMMILKEFPKLRHLNLAWTSVTKLPALQSLKHLNMANCTIVSIFEDWEGLEGFLEELYLSGANISNPSEVFSGQWASNLLLIDFSSSYLKDFEFLDGKCKLEVLNLGGTIADNVAMKTVARIGFKLKQLDLSGCKVDSEGIGALARHLPKVEQIILSGTQVDDSVFTFLQVMTSLKSIDLSYTNVKGFNTEVNGQTSNNISFISIQQLQCLTFLNLRNTLLSDEACQGFTSFHKLTHLHLRSERLSDYALHYLSALKKLVSLSVEGAMLTDSGILSFRTPVLLKELSLLDCWLLTRKALLRFHEVHRGIILRHALLSNAWGTTKSGLPKESEIKGESRSKQSNYGKAVSPSQLNVRKIDHQKKTKALEVVVDERIKYTKSDLLCLRASEPRSQQLGILDLSDICCGLSSLETINLGLP